uniref:Uncharacterized protein n=1 Tax=Cyclopterus lumpus TaxID=8103 RepID=A0A8C2XI16_CYCLU
VWAQRIPKSRRYDPSEAPETHHSEAVGSGHGLPSGHRNVQCNALQHWHTHMMQRRQQQDFLSGELVREYSNLLQKVIIPALNSCHSSTLDMYYTYLLSLVFCHLSESYLIFVIYIILPHVCPYRYFYGLGLPCGQ